MRIKTNSGVGRPKFKMPKVKTNFRKRGYALKAMHNNKKKFRLR